MDYSSLIDHTLLRADASPDEIKQLCTEAIRHRFHSVCVNPSYVAYVSDQLHNTGIKVCSVVGFPLGQTTTKQKVYEAKQAIKDGAHEIDMVLNVAEFKAGCRCVIDEIRAVKKACKKALLKVIVETALLTEEQVKNATLAVIDGGADFVKTSTGFSSRGASVRDVQIMKQAITDHGAALQIKASGGIKTLSDLKQMVAAGATRIGCSKGVAIAEEASRQGK